MSDKAEEILKLLKGISYDKAKDILEIALENLGGVSKVD